MSKGLKVSKNVRDGQLVVWRGDKLIRTSRLSKIPAGKISFLPITWKFIVIDFKGETQKFSVDLPPGLQIYGLANVQIGTEKKGG